MLQKFIINFWVWWYFIKVKDSFNDVVRTWLYFAGILNIFPMARNLFVPLYQDYSMIGRLTSLMIRSVWVSVTGIIQFFITIPLFLYVVFIFILPVGIIGMIVISFL